MKTKQIVSGIIGLALGLGVAVTARGDAKDVTVTGEVIDTFCFAAMGAKGASHRDCGLKCAKAGIPVGLLEEKTNKVYVLLPNKDAMPVPAAAIDKMGQKATITGHTYTSGGTNFLTVESVK